MTLTSKASVVRNVSIRRGGPLRAGCVLWLASTLAAVFALISVAAPAAQGQTYHERVLYSFAGGTDGANPYAGLVRDPARNLYGTTDYGGAYQGGTVFKVSASGVESVLHSFTGGADGVHPLAGLVRDPAGNLYGTTEYGGAYQGGTVFKVSASVESVLHSFCPAGFACADGSTPEAGLLRDAGNLYGTTEYGGTYGGGTVFKVSASGVESVLYSFTGGADGSLPFAGLVRDSAGNLYGTTELLYGTVFEVSASGVESTLYKFTGGADGSRPFAGLVRDSAGNLYGTTEYGGAYGGGTVFKVSASGVESVLYSFCSQSGCTDGSNPVAGLVRDAAGNLYGTTAYGGAVDCFGVGCGTVFKLSASGVESVLYTFCSQSGCTDGASPVAGLIRGPAGNLYGTTYEGGAYGWGTVFELTPEGAPSQ